MLLWLAFILHIFEIHPYCRVYHGFVFLILVQWSLNEYTTVYLPTLLRTDVWNISIWDCYEQSPLSFTYLSVDISMNFRGVYRHTLFYCASLYCASQILHFHQHQGKTHHQQNNYSSLKARLMVNIFQQKSIFKLKYVHCFQS